MRLFLDDVRNPPSNEEWVLVRDPEEFMKIFKENHEKITAISLDHDLGDPDEVPITGLHIVRWLILNYKEAMRNILVLIHSANPVGAENMLRELWDNKISAKRRQVWMT